MLLFVAIGWVFHNRQVKIVDHECEWPWYPLHLAPLLLARSLPIKAELPTQAVSGMPNLFRRDDEERRLP